MPIRLWCRISREEAEPMRNAIWELVQQLMKKYGTQDPYELMDCLGINLLIRDNLGSLKGFYFTLSRERYIVVNGQLRRRDQLMVAAHELGHDRLHRKLARVSPLKDFAFYEIASQTEYEANLFASELLISDEDVEECISEDLDYLSMCRTLSFHPQLVSFKLYGMMRRGYRLNLPEGLDSRFMGK